MVARFKVTSGAKKRPGVFVSKAVGRMLPVTRLLYWIGERERIRKLKESGAPQPWTRDPILRQFRFCNVRREDDKVTRWLAQNWREPNQEDPDLWFAMLVARHINLPETLEEIGYPVPWLPGSLAECHTSKQYEITPHNRFTQVMSARRKKGLTSYNAAYMIRASKAKNKAVYLREQVFSPAWKNRAAIRPVKGELLESFFTRLSGCYGLGTFMAAQVVADVKYVPLLRNAPDWSTFVASGPGSKRGLNLILGRDMKAAWREQDWREELSKLRRNVNTRLERAGVEPLHAQDLQNCLCEYSKYEKARQGLGRPKQRYSCQ